MSVERVFPIHKTRKVVHGFSLSPLSRRGRGSEASARARAHATERPRPSVRSSRVGSTGRARQHAPRRIPLPAGLLSVPRGVRASRLRLGETHAVSDLPIGPEASETAPDGGGSAGEAPDRAATSRLSSVLVESTYAFAVKPCGRAGRRHRRAESFLPTSACSSCARRTAVALRRCCARTSSSRSGACSRTPPERVRGRCPRGLQRRSSPGPSTTTPRASPRRWSPSRLLGAGTIRRAPRPNPIFKETRCTASPRRRCGPIAVGMHCGA